MNLKSLLEECYRRVALPAVPSASDTTRLTAFLNTTHRQILGLPGLESLRDDTIVLNSSESRIRYGLPPAIARIEGIADRANAIDLQLMTLQELRASDPGLTATGLSHSYVVRGYQAVHTQPVNDIMFVRSTHVGDTTQKVYVEGVRFSGHTVLSQFTTLNGTIPVQVGGPIDWEEITKFFLQEKCQGAVGLFQDAACTMELAAINPEETFSRYLAIQLYPTPSSVITYYIDYVRTVFDLVLALDEPLLPEDFHWLLVEGALLKEWTKRDDDRRVAAEREYTKGIGALKYFVTCQADALPVSGQRVTWRHSRYGAHYPSMRY